MKSFWILLAGLCLAAFSTAQAAPTANDQSLSVHSGHRRLLFLSFSDSSKPVGDMRFQILDGPEHGTVLPHPTQRGSYYYASSSGYLGPDSFTWRCSDGSWSEPATYSFDVVQNPRANDQDATVYNGGAAGRQAITLSSAYNLDLRRSGAAFTLLTPPSHGTLDWGAGQPVAAGMPVADASPLFTDAYARSRTWYYTPNPGYTGEDSFTWKWNYGGVEVSNTGTVSITVSPNTPPVASDLSRDLTRGTVSSLNLAAGVEDPDRGQTIVYEIVTYPQYGVLLQSSWSSAFWYLPLDPGFTGADSFTWRASDGIDASGVATFTINVIESANLPMPQHRREPVPTNMSSAIPAPFTGDRSYTMQLQIRAHPHSGTVVADNTTLAFTYTPDDGFSGQDAFDWRIRYHNGAEWVTTIERTMTLDVYDSLPRALNMPVVGVVDQTISKDFSFVSALPSTSSYRPVIDVAIVEPPANGVLRVTGRDFVYTPNPGWSGEDSFVWKFHDGTSESNMATNSILVREETDRAGMTVLVVVNDLLLPEIEYEINRLLADLDNEGYTPVLTPWSGWDAQELWRYLQSEYRTPCQFVSGAMLIGHLPAGRNLQTDQITDYAFMNMEIFGDTSGVTKQHIWVSRIIADDFAGGEALRIRWALDANHGYRTGAHRLPHSAHWHDLAYKAVNSLNAANMLIVWPTVGGGHPSTIFRTGAEFQNSEIHAGGAFTYWNWRPAQLRYSIHSSCGPGRLGGPVNRNLLSRGGGMIVSMGSTATAYSLQNVVVADQRVDYFHVLKRGDTLGHGITRGVNPYRDYWRNIFYGDLSLPAKAAPANQLPVIHDFNANATQGVAPLEVDFYAVASDPDGNVDRYEWFAEGFHDGIYGPTDVSEVHTSTHAYSHPRRFEAEVQVVDNYQARRWSSMEIRVAPNPSQALRINCGRNVTYYSPRHDYIAADETLWQHDQSHAAGTWGYAGGSEANVSQDVNGTEDEAIYQRFREGGSFSYRIPLASGGYTIRLHFADMRSSGEGVRVMDIGIQGITRLEALDPAAVAGVKTALVLPLNVVVEDGDEGMLAIEVARNAAATQDAFLNAIEIEPGLHAPNSAPYAPDQAFTGQAGQGLAMTLTARDPEADPLTWTLMSAPVNGTLSGTLPHLVYTPDDGFSGEDSFTFKVNDGVFDSRVATVSIEVLAVPLVALISPDNETVFPLPADVLLQAEVGLLGQGGIASVEFFRDDLLLHEAVSEPYKYLWEGVTLPGTYRLWARATTEDGIAADSDPVVVELMPHSVFVWQSDAPGSWLVEGNWTPEGFVNTNVHACVVSNGTARTGSTAFQPTLTLAGENGAGGELEVTGSHATGSNGIRLAGGRIWRAGNYSRTLTAAIEAVAGTVSIVHADGGNLRHSGALRGTGTVRVGGAAAWEATTTLQHFGGVIEAVGGTIRLRNNGTFAMGSGGRLRIREGGTMTIGNYSTSWSVPGGVTLGGGTYRESGSGGTTWSVETPWTIDADSVIETDGSGGFVDIRGPLHGAGTLTIRRAAGSGDRAVTLRGSGSTYSGLIAISSSPTNAFLYFGHSEAVANQGALTSLSIDAPIGDEVPGLVIVGARKSGATATNIDNVHVKLRCLVLDGNWIEAGVYDQANPGPTAGFIVFHNPLSSLEVLESDPGLPPEITSPATASGAPGQPFTYAITASGAAPMRYSAEGLPSGLSLDGSVISGIPAETGLFSVLITVANLAGTDTLELALTVDSAHRILASCEPGGTIQPSGAVFVADGDGQAFTIVPDAGHVVMDVLVDGETVGAVTNYLFQSVSREYEIQARFHEVRLHGMTGGDAGPTIRFDTLPNRVYELIYKDDLLDPGEWQSLTNITGTGEEATFVDSEQTPSRFYRLRLLD